MPNNSLERTQPQRDFMYDVAVLRRSARGRWAAEQKMPIPEPIRRKAEAGLRRMQADPLHHFDWRTRREIYLLFSPLSDPHVYRARCRLPILAAKHVLPIFSNHFPDDDLPQKLIDIAIGIVDGNIQEDDRRVIETEDQGYHATGGYMAYDEKAQKVLHNANYAAFAAYKALVEIRHMPDPWEHAQRFSKSNDLYSTGGATKARSGTPGTEFTDEDWAGLAAAGDTAAAAAMAYATSEDNSAPNSDRLADFWTWWVHVALPEAWLAIEG